MAEKFFWGDLKIFTFIISCLTIISIILIIKNEILKTKIKKIEEQKNKDVIQLLKSLGNLGNESDLFRLILHQLRDDINSIDEVVQLLNMNSLTAEEKQEIISSAQVYTKRLKEVVDAFSNLYRNVNTKKNFFSVYEVMVEAIQTSKSELKKESEKVSICILGGEDICVFGIRIYYYNSLIVILKNAIQVLYSRNIPNPEIRLEVKEKNNKTYLRISDNGGKTRTKIIRKIFQENFSTKKNGCGIGLHLSRKILRDTMGGDIQVETEKEGLAFSIITPSLN